MWVHANREGYGSGVRINRLQTMRFGTERGGGTGVSAVAAAGRGGSKPRLDGAELVSGQFSLNN